MKGLGGLLLAFASVPGTALAAEETRLEFFANSSAGEAAHLLTARREADAPNNTERWVRLANGRVYPVRGEFVLAFNNRKADDRSVGVALVKVFRRFSYVRQPTETRLILRNQHPQAWLFPSCGARRSRYFEPIKGSRHFAAFTGLSRAVLDGANIRCAHPFRYFQATPFGARDLRLMSFLDWIDQVPDGVRQHPGGWGREVYAHSYRIYVVNGGRGMPYPFIGIQSFGATEAIVEVLTSSNYYRKVTVKFQ